MKPRDVALMAYFTDSVCLLNALQHRLADANDRIVGALGTARYGLAGEDATTWSSIDELTVEQQRMLARSADALELVANVRACLKQLEEKTYRARDAFDGDDKDLTPPTGDELTARRAAKQREGA
jgi:hypothetical protein